MGYSRNTIQLYHVFFGHESTSTSIINGLTINPDGSTQVEGEGTEKILNVALAPVDLNTLLGNQLTYSTNLTTQEVSNILDVGILIADNTGNLWRDLNYHSSGTFTDIGGHYIITAAGDIQINFNPTSDFVTSALYNAASVRIRITYIPD